MAKAIDNALTLPKEKRAQITEAASKHIRNKFSLQAMCDRTIKVYNDILEEKCNMPLAATGESSKLQDNINNTPDKHPKELEPLDA